MIRQIWIFDGSLHDPKALSFFIYMVRTLCTVHRLYYIVLYYIDYMIKTYFVTNFLFIKITISTLFMTSSFAHLLNCISFRARHICFCSDYAAILYYTIGCALVNSASVVPNYIWSKMHLGPDGYLR